MDIVIKVLGVHSKSFLKVRGGRKGRTPIQEKFIEMEILNKLAEIVVNMQRQMKRLKEHNETGIDARVLVTDALAELDERHRRAGNIIIFGVPSLVMLLDRKIKDRRPSN